MSAEAEKAPEVAKDEEKTSEELKATKRAAEVSEIRTLASEAPGEKIYIRLDIVEIWVP